MASASSEPVASDAAARERAAALKEELRRSERRREAAEQWTDLLAAELEARDERLEDVIAEYERQLEAAKERNRPRDGPLTRLLERLRSALA